MKQSYKLVELTPEEFENFVKDKKPNNFLQSREMFSRYQKDGKEAYLLGLLSADKTSEILLASLVVKLGEIRGQKTFSAPGGPIFDYENEDWKNRLEAFLSLVKPFLKSKHGMTLQISPNIAVESGQSAPDLPGMKALGEYVQCKWISVLNLEDKTEDFDVLLSTFRKTHRQNIRHGENRYFLETRELSYDELPILKKLAKKAGEKHGFHDQSLEYYEEMFRAFGNKLKVFATFYEGKPIAAAMFILYGDEVVSLYSGSDPEYNKIAGSYSLQWFMIKYAISHGFKRYNFYGVRPEPGNGVFEFKAGFRAEVKELWGTYILPLSPLGKLYCLKKKYHKYGEVA